MIVDFFFLKLLQYSQESKCVCGLKACNFIKKRLQHRLFLVNMAKFLRTPILKNICERLLLEFQWTMAVFWPFGNFGIGISASASSLELTLASALQKNCFRLRKFSWKNRICSFLCLVMASVPLCYKYLFLYDNLLIHSKASIDKIEKGYLNFRKNPSIGVLKK